MCITIRGYRLLGIALLALAATVLSGCSQRWSLEVQSLYSKPVRIYIEHMGRIPPETELLGQVCPNTTGKFLCKLEDSYSVWHIIVEDTSGKTLQDIRADGDAIRAEAKRAHGREPVWRLTVGPKPGAKADPPKEHAAKVLVNARRGIERGAVGSITVAWLQPGLESPNNPPPEVLEDERATVRVVLRSKSALRAIGDALLSTRVTGPGKADGEFVVGCWLTDHKGKRMYTFYLTSFDKIAIVNNCRVTLEGALFEFLKGYAGGEKRPRS